MTTATRRKASPGARDAAIARRTALMAQLDEFAANLDEDDVLVAKVAVWNQHYSERNADLIVMQAPDATEIRGYRDWQAHGRQVRKGEHGIAILAPAGHTDATPATDGKPAEAEHRFFRLISVFDISQTDPIEEV